MLMFDSNLCSVPIRISETLIPADMASSIHERNSVFDDMIVGLESCTAVFEDSLCGAVVDGNPQVLILLFKR